MEVAVLIGGHELVAGSHGEGDGGLLTGLQSFALISLLGLQADPLDVVFFLHGVGNRTNGDSDLVTVHRYHRDMFFRGGVCGVCHHFLHLFPAADNFRTVVLNVGNDVAAVGTFVEFHIHDHNLLYKIN